MTAIMRAEHQEPEVARFIDSYKYDQQTAERRQKYGGGTSLPLDSDGYEDRQRKLKEELRNDFLVQQEKPAVLRNALLLEKKNLELQKIEARRNRPPPPVTQPPAGQIDYDQQNLRARTEDRRAYQDHMKAQEERYWRMRGKPVTPPGGLDIGHYDKHVKEQAPQKKKEYKETLDQQQKEQMYIRARQEPEMPVLDRSPPQQATYLASKPPPGPQQGHPQRDQQPNRQTPNYWNDGKRERSPVSLVSESSKHSKATKNNGVPLPPKTGHSFISRATPMAFRTEQYVHQAPQQVSQTENLHQTMNGHNQMNRPHAPLPRSPEKFRKSSPTLMALDKQFEDQSQRTQPKSQITNSGVTGYQPSFQEPGQRQPERPRPTPSAFQTHPNTGGNYANEGAVERLPLRESRNFDNQEEPTAPKENPPIGGLYVFDDTKHDKIKRQIYEMKKKDYAEYLQRKQDEEQRRHEEVRRHRGTPAGFQKDHHYSSDEYEKFQRNLQKQEGEEYREFLKKKNQEVRNREWNFGNSGVLDLRGDDENQSRKQLLREERQKEYNEFMNQTQRKLNRTWPEPDGRGALLVKKGEYDNVRNMYSNERKQELQQYLNEKDPQQQAPRTQEPRSKSQPVDSGFRNNFNPFVNAFGKYHDTRQKLAEDRKKEFKIFMAEKKKHEVVPKRGSVEAVPKIAKEEKPLVNSMGLYENETRKKFLLERKKDFANHNHKQEKGWTPRNNVKENLMPHVASAETPLVNYMGHYDEEKSKFRVQRNKDFKEFSYKKKQEYHSPYENFVYPMVAVAEKPLVEHMGRDIEQRRLELRQERRHDYERYQSQQRIRDPPRRNDYFDPRNGPYDGIFSGLGDHGNTKEVLGQQRKQEYNQYLDQYPQTKAGGRPTWVKETLPNNTDRGRSPMRNPQPVDHYQQMLDEKRREEAQRRRFDDPEYQGRLPPNSREARYNEDMQQQKYGYYQQE